MSSIKTTHTQLSCSIDFDFQQLCYPRWYKCSPPPSPVSAVWSLDFESLHFSQTAWTEVSPAEQDQPWNPAAASGWLSGPEKHMHIATLLFKLQTVHTHRWYPPLQNTQYLHTLQLLFAESVLFLQWLILDLHTDESPLHLSSLILQLKSKKDTQSHWFLSSNFHFTVK